jgi:predicted TIM-barrel fold metal-dependent hydrolase
VTHRLLRASGVGWFLLDTGYQAGQILGPAEMAAASGAIVAEIVRLESLAEEVAASGVPPHRRGARARAFVAESLEVAPFGKLLFSSDACGPAELHYLGALLWRRAMASVLGEWVQSGEWSSTDAIRVAQMVGADNTKRVYRLAESTVTRI